VTARLVADAALIVPLVWPLVVFGFDFSFFIVLAIVFNKQDGGEFRSIGHRDFPP
jgi:hypothetical protein